MHWGRLWECAPTGLRSFFQLPKSRLILFLKPLGDTRFAFPRQVWPCREREAIESVPVAQALREESTHGRPRALREEFVKSTQVSSHHLVKQGLRAATLHTPHQRARGASEIITQPSFMAVVLPRP